MTEICRHNPLLQHRLSTFVQTGDALGLTAALHALSNKDRRTAGYLLGEILLPQLQTAETFWQLFLPIVSTDSKAYLVTFLKAATHLYKRGIVQFTAPQLETFAEQCTSIDREKVLKTILPILQSPTECRHLLHIFEIKQDRHGAHLLLQAGTVACYYLLFHMLKAMEDEALLTSCCKALIRKGDSVSFNMASILCHYFDLTGIPSLFSLRIEPYQLSRLDVSFKNFKQTLLQS